VFLSKPSRAHTPALDAAPLLPEAGERPDSAFRNLFGCTPWNEIQIRFKFNTLPIDISVAGLIAWASVEIAKFRALQREHDRRLMQ
jgi:hypothetical protein